MTVRELGLVVVEPATDDGPELLVMFPDGTVRHSKDNRQAGARIASWQRRHTPRFGAAVLRVEWRNCKPAAEAK